MGSGMPLRNWWSRSDSRRSLLVTRKLEMSRKRRLYALKLLTVSTAVHWAAVQDAHHLLGGRAYAEVGGGGWIGMLLNMCGDSIGGGRWRRLG